eukprot:s3384_g2.t1
MSDAKAKLPGVIKIQYCVKCKWQLRAAWLAQELLSTFEQDDILSEVSLVPSLKVSGVFEVTCDGRTAPWAKRQLSYCCFACMSGCKMNVYNFSRKRVHSVGNHIARPCELVHACKEADSDLLIAISSPSPPKRFWLRARKRMECEVCVVGLGVSSLPLLKLLQQSSTDFRVVSSTAFGIWEKLTAAGENFDLVTTIESTNYSWWDYDYEFPFYTARGYHDKLLAELTPDLMDRLVRKDVTQVDETGGRYRVWSGDEHILTCSKLVHAIGFAPDKNIFSNLSCIANAGRQGGKHFLIFGFSDTTNLYISRLIHAGHRVTLACRHFHVVDKTPG